MNERRHHHHHYHHHFLLVVVVILTRRLFTTLEMVFRHQNPRNIKSHRVLAELFVLFSVMPAFGKFQFLTCSLHPLIFFLRRLGTLPSDSITSDRVFTLTFHNILSSLKKLIYLFIIPNSFSSRQSSAVRAKSIIWYNFSCLHPLKHFFFLGLCNPLEFITPKTFYLLHSL